MTLDLSDPPHDEEREWIGQLRLVIGFGLLAGFAAAAVLLFRC